MTGTVSELSRGTLSFAIDGAGTVDINWRNVNTLQSSRILDIELTSGDRLTGLITSPSARQLQVRTASGMRTIRMDDVIRIKAIAATFRERTTGAVDLGLSFLSAGSERNWTFNGEAENRTRNYLTNLSLRSLLRHTNGENTQSRNHFNLGTRRFLRKKNFVLAQFRVEEDKALELDSRILIGAAFGRMLVQNNRTNFAAYAGLDYNHENYQDVSGNDNAELLGALEWDWFELGGNTELLTEATTYLGLNRSRIRIELDAGLRHTIIRDLYWSLTVYESYDSDPPTDKRRSDFGIALTLGHSF